MPARTDLNSCLTHGYDDGDPNWGRAVNENFERISRLAFNPAVEGVNITTPPASPPDGSSYILGASPTGDWSTFNTGQIAYYNGTSWVAYTAAEGWIVFDKTTNRPYAFDGSVWAELETGVTAQSLTQTAYDALTPTQKNEDKLYLIHA